MHGIAMLAIAGCLAPTPRGNFASAGVVHERLDSPRRKAERQQRVPEDLKAAFELRQDEHACAASNLDELTEFALMRLGSGIDAQTAADEAR